MGDLIVAFFLNAVFWSIRLKHDSQGVKDELGWILASFFWSQRHSLFWEGSVLSKVVFALFFLSTCFHLSHPLNHRGPFPHTGDIDTKSINATRTTVERYQNSLPPILKPLFFPCRITHTRLFPKKHSFSYSYLCVGIPIGWQGSLNSFFSVDFGSHLTGKAYQQWWRSWFSIKSTDYLNRGSHAAGLKGKLDDYLESQDEDPNDFAHAYLVTAPRFLGYAFNPVSFWYLYDEEKELKAMILEVNNTSDERRMYFLKASDFDLTTPKNINRSIPGLAENEDFKKTTAIVSDIEIQPSTRFVSRWAKDFHVSPFNSREGFYTLSAHDPFYPSLSGKGSINNLVNLLSSKENVKMVTRIFSTAESIDPSLLNLLERLKVIASWWWVGLLTFPRVLHEAGKLFFRRKLHVWRRPEVLEGSIGRQETSDERILECSFRAYLRYQVEHSKNLTLPLKYTSSSSFPREEMIYPINTIKKPTATDIPSAEHHITLTINTPLFYTLIARNPNPALLFLSPSPYMHTSHPKLLSNLFLLSPEQKKQPPSRLWLRIIISFLLQKHRRNPLDNRQALALALAASEALRRQYGFILFKLLLSDRIFLGQTIVFDILFFVARILIVYSYTLALLGGWHYYLSASAASGSGMGFALFSSSSSLSTLSSTALAAGASTWARLFGVHIWWLIAQLI